MHHRSPRPLNRDYLLDPQFEIALEITSCWICSLEPLKAIWPLVFANIERVTLGDQTVQARCLWRMRAGGG